MEKKEREISEKKNNGPTSAVMVKYLVAIQIWAPAAKFATEVYF